jgi:hypothetical protein
VDGFFTPISLDDFHGICLVERKEEDKKDAVVSVVVAVFTFPFFLSFCKAEGRRMSPWTYDPSTNSYKVKFMQVSRFLATIHPGWYRVSCYGTEDSSWLNIYAYTTPPAASFIDSFHLSELYMTQEILTTPREQTVFRIIDVEGEGTVTTRRCCMFGKKGRVEKKRIFQVLHR